jgi:hypothetical protein
MLLYLIGTIGFKLSIIENELKNINKGLKESLIANGLTEPNGMQKKLFSTLKVEQIVLLLHQVAVKQQIVINVIQQLVKEGEQSPERHNG